MRSFSTTAAVRTVTITPQNNPDRRDVQIAVAWDFQNTALQEQLDTTIYPR